jgi:quercetin dioxygenase-like cupin family protein
MTRIRCLVLSSWLLVACGGGATGSPPAATAGGESAASTSDAPAGGAPAAPEVLDPVQVSPDVFKVLLDGPRMRVIEATWKPGQKDNPHGHPELVAYGITDVHGIAYDDDGTPVSIRAKKGRVFIQAPVGSHAFKNQGASMAKLLIVELKDAPPAPMPSGAPNDAITASPDIYEFMGSDPKVKVLLATWPPGGRDEFHGHPATAVYAITDVRGSLYDEDGKATPVSMKAGETRFEDPIKAHSFENTGSAPAQMLIIEKRK